MTGSDFLRAFGRNASPSPSPNLNRAPAQNKINSGVPSLLELFNNPKYGELLNELYPDRSEDARKQALGSFLLGSLAPAGLRIAQGVPIAQALEPTLTDLATAGSEARRVKDVTEQARREERFKLASDELTRRRASEAEANKLQAFPAGSQVFRGSNLAFSVPEKFTGKTLFNEEGEATFVTNQNEENSAIEKGFNQTTRPPKEKTSVDPGTIGQYVYTGKEPLQTPFGTFEPNARYPLGSKQLASLGASQALFKKYEKPEIDRFNEPKELYNLETGQQTSVLTPTAYEEAMNLGFTSTVAPKDKVFADSKFYRNTDTNEVRAYTNEEFAKLPREERNQFVPYKDEGRGTLQQVAFKTPQVIAGKLRPAGTVFRMYDDEIKALSGEARGELITPTEMSDVKIVYKRNEETGGVDFKSVFTPQDLQDAVNDGFTVNSLKDFAFVRMYKMVEKDGESTPVYATAKSEAQQNKLIEQGYGLATPDDYKVIGNKLFAVSPEGTRLIIDEKEPINLFNADNKVMRVKTEEEIQNAVANGYIRTTPTETKGLTEARARVLMVPVAQKIASGNFSPQDKIDFESNLSAIISARRLVPNPDGGFMMSDANVPPFVIDAIRKARLKDETFPTYGLLPEDETTEQAENAILNYDGIIQNDIDYLSNLGPQAKIARGIEQGANFFSLLTTGDEISAQQGRAALDDINALNAITVTRTLGALGGKDTDALRKKIEELNFDPYGAGTTPALARSKTSNMLSFISDSIKTLQDELETANTITAQTKIRKDISNLSYLKGEYQKLLDRLTVGKKDPKEYERKN
jgi:hypothetical protein